MDEYRGGPWNFFDGDDPFPLDENPVESEAVEEESAEKKYSPDKGLFSVWVALQEISSQIKRISAEMGDLEKVINSLKDNAIIIDYSKKGVLLNKLYERGDEIAYSEGSYGNRKEKVSRSDKRINDLYSKIGEKEEQQKGINEESKNPKILRLYSKLEVQIDKLKTKQGKMEERQRKIINKKVAHEIKHMRRKSKSEGRIIGLNAIIDSHKQRIEDKTSELSAESTLGQGISAVKTIVTSYASVGVLTAYLKTIDFKNKILTGAKSLPINIAKKLLEEIKNIKPAKRR